MELNMEFWNAFLPCIEGIYIIDEETKEICQTISKDYSFMDICPLSEFEELFGKQGSWVQE